MFHLSFLLYLATLLPMSLMIHLLTSLVVGNAMLEVTRVVVDTAIDGTNWTADCLNGHLVHHQFLHHSFLLHLSKWIPLKTGHDDTSVTQEGSKGQLEVLTLTPS